MRALKKREKIMFTVCLAVIGFYMILSGVLDPIFRNSDFLDYEISSARRSLRKEQSLIAQAEAQRAQYRFYREHFGRPAADEEIFTDMLAQIENVAAPLDVKISDMKPKQTRDEEQYKLFSVSLIISASMNDFLAFVDTLQRQPYYWGAEELSVERVSYDEPGGLSFRMSLTKLLIPERP